MGEKFASQEKLEDISQQIVGKCNRIVNESVPIVDARLDNGARVNIVMPPVALNGPVITIRRFPDHPISMDQLIPLGCGFKGSCYISADAGVRGIQHFYLRWHRLRQDNIFECVVALYSER